MFNKLPIDGWEWTQFGIDPFFAVVHATQTAFVCMRTNSYYSRGAANEEYFPDLGIDFFEALSEEADQT